MNNKYIVTYDRWWDIDHMGGENILENDEFTSESDARLFIKSLEEDEASWRYTNIKLLQDITLEAKEEPW